MALFTAVAMVMIQPSYAQKISGSDPKLGATYSAEQTGNVVAVSLTVNGKEIQAKIDYATHRLHVHSKSIGSGEATALDQADINAFETLLRSRKPDQSQLDDAITSTLNFLSNYHAGDVVNIDINTDMPSITPRAAATTITPICSQINSSITGTYTVGGVSYTQTATCGPCGSGECVGRCGPGCSVPPSPFVQRFTQECFNHDLCHGATGQILGPCADEWVKAAPGFFFGTDCANMGGTWLDVFDYEWTLTETSGTITGSVSVGACGTWSVSGTRDGFGLTLTATNPSGGDQNCCSAFTYTGAEKCNTASGNWTNPCTLSGNWSMTRESNGLRPLLTTLSHGGPANRR
jgi:hypothetical protein